MITVLSYLGAAWILISYFFLLKKRCNIFQLNLANFFGSIPLAIVEARANLWGPFFISVSFGLIGLYGIFSERKRIDNG